MWRHAGPRLVRLWQLGDGLQMKCSDLTALRGSAQVVSGTPGSAALGFKYTCNPFGEGVFIENGTADRLTFSGVAPTVSSSAVDCTGFAQVRLEVINIGSATTDAEVLVELFSYSPIATFGEIMDQGILGFGTGISSTDNVPSDGTRSTDTFNSRPASIFESGSGSGGGGGPGGG